MAFVLRNYLFVIEERRLFYSHSKTSKKIYLCIENYIKGFEFFIVNFKMIRNN